MLIRQKENYFGEIQKCGDVFNVKQNTDKRG